MKENKTFKFSKIIKTSLVINIILIISFLYCIIFRLFNHVNPHINGFEIFNLLAMIGFVLAITFIILGSILLHKNKNEVNENAKKYYRYLIILGIITLILSIIVIMPIFIPKKTL
jgi:cytochrome bd-type quinol oxidase subunit 2